MHEIGDQIGFVHKDGPLPELLEVFESLAIILKIAFKSTSPHFYIIVVISNPLNTVRVGYLLYYSSFYTIAQLLLHAVV